MIRNKSIALLTALSVGAQPWTPAFAGEARDKADEIILKSHESARLVAEDAFRAYLMKGAQQVLINSMGLNALVYSLNNIDASQNQIHERIDKIIRDGEQFTDIGVFETRNHDQIFQALRQTVAEYERALVALRRMRHNINGAASEALRARDYMNNLVADMEKTCQQGVAQDFYSPNFPRVSFSPPGFEVGVDVQFESAGPTGTTQSQTSVRPYFSPLSSNQFWGKDTGAYMAALNTVTYAGLVMLLNHLSHVAIMATPTMQVALMAGVYTIIIWIIIYIVMDAMVRVDAKEMAVAVERVAVEKADAMDVARYFRGVCSRYLPKLQEAVKLIGALEKAGTDSDEMRIFSQREEEAQKNNAKLGDLRAALQKKDQELSASNPTDHQKLLLESAENKALKDFVVNEMGFEKIMEMLAVGVTEVGLASQRTLDLVRKIKVSDREAAAQGEEAAEDRLRALRDRIQMLYDLSYQQSLNQQRPGLAVALADDLNANREHRELYLRFQKEYVDVLVDIFGQNALEKHRETLQGFAETVEAGLAKAPSNQLLLLMKRRIAQLQNILAAK